LSRHGANNNSQYLDNEVDIFALVTLDTRLVGYVSKEDFRKTLTFRVDSFRGSYYDEKGEEDYTKVIELYKETKNQSEIARMFLL